jgi:RimJ/RimL family protein N-acetyltransferase
MAYGFETLNLHRTEAITSHTNQRSWQLMERLGMRREGHFRETRFRDGEWHDTFIYDILAGK